MRRGDGFVHALVFTAVGNGLTLFPLVSGADGSSFQKERDVCAGSIWDSSLGIDLCSSAVAHCLLRIHLFVHSKAGASCTPLGMPQKNKINGRF